MILESVVEQIEIKYNHLTPLLNERSRRLWAATEASALGYGGILALHRATGLSQNTIRAGLKELTTDSAQLPPPKQIRQSGGGRKRVEVQDPSILEVLDRLVEPSSRGEPECPLRWTCKSVNQLAGALQAQGVWSLCDDGLDSTDRLGLQFAEQSQDPGRAAASGSRCPVSTHCSTGRSVSTPASSRDLD